MLSSFYLYRHVLQDPLPWEEDLQQGCGAVVLPDALARKIPGAPKEWKWQWVFPATSRYTERGSGVEL